MWHTLKFSVGTVYDARLRRIIRNTALVAECIPASSTATKNLVRVMLISFVFQYEQKLGLDVGRFTRVLVVSYIVDSGLLSIVIAMWRARTNSSTSWLTRRNGSLGMGRRKRRSRKSIPFLPLMGRPKEKEFEASPGQWSWDPTWNIDVSILETAGSARCWTPYATACWYSYKNAKP